MSPTIDRDQLVFQAQDALAGLLRLLEDGHLPLGEVQAEAAAGLAFLRGLAAVTHQGPLAAEQIKELDVRAAFLGLVREEEPSRAFDQEALARAQLVLAQIEKLQRPDPAALRATIRTIGSAISSALQAS